MENEAQVVITLTKAEAEMAASAINQLRGRAYAAGEVDLLDQATQLTSKFDEAIKAAR